MTRRGKEQRRPQNVAKVMVGFRCAPVTPPKAMVNSARAKKLVKLPTTGPMKAALSKFPSCAVGGVGMTPGDRLEKMVMYTSMSVPVMVSLRIRRMM